MFLNFNKHLSKKKQHNCTVFQVSDNKLDKMPIPGGNPKHIKTLQKVYLIFTCKIIIAGTLSLVFLLILFTFFFTFFCRQFSWNSKTEYRYFEYFSCKRRVQITRFWLSFRMKVVVIIALIALVGGSVTFSR